ncbi:glycosyltransferase family 4 protein [Janibacter melonis]|uniref:glycosyltransferase family 4 protein n=1 Tax=Janibacter melonis TaxID=262209 RepID=UPI001E651A9A|nr:glycosyltransferase family 4 protein [Janibacter melonis]MCB5992681.1 glycosyltransferase family 4 protein [Janibacter melonis]
MKVALLTDCYPPRVGGIESQVADLAAHLVDDGHEVEVFTATTGAAGQSRGDVEEGPVRVHRLAEPLLRVPVNPFAVPELRRRLAAGSFDVAHVHVGVVSPFAWDAARVSTGLGLPTAITWHCVLHRAAALYRASGVLARWTGRGAVLSAVSTFAAGQVRAAAPAGTQVAVLPNAIDLDRWRPHLPRSTGRDDDQYGVVAGGEGGSTAGDGGSAAGDGGPVRLVSTMRLAPRKRPLELVDAFVAAGLGDRARLEVVGDGPLRDRLERRAAELPTGQVVVRGRLPREDLRALYADADGYLAPTRLEAFGIAVLEARAAGLPVVAMGGSGVDDVVDDGVSGLLVPDDAGLTRAVARLVTDDALRARMAAHNRTTPPRQVWSHVLPEVLAEYERAGAR